MFLFSLFPGIIPWVMRNFFRVFCCDFPGRIRSLISARFSIRWKFFFPENRGLACITSPDRILIYFISESAASSYDTYCFTLFFDLSDFSPPYYSLPCHVPRAGFRSPLRFLREVDTLFLVGSSGEEFRAEDVNLDGSFFCAQMYPSLMTRFPGNEFLIYPFFFIECCCCVCLIRAIRLCMFHRRTHFARFINLSVGIKDGTKNGWKRDPFGSIVLIERNAEVPGYPLRVPRPSTRTPMKPNIWIINDSRIA